MRPHAGFLAVAFAVAATAAARGSQTTIAAPAFRADSATSLSAAVTREVAARHPGGVVAVCVMSADSGAVLVDIEADKPLKPASTNKLHTTAAALDLLGPDFRFETKLVAWGSVTTAPGEASGVLAGDLAVIGGGDPTISARFEADKRDTTAVFRRWAARLKAVGVTTVTGDLVVDDAVFDGEWFHPTWSDGERAEWYEAEVSGLAFNDNCLDLHFSAEGLLPGAPAALAVEPVTVYARVENRVTVSATGRPAGRGYKRAADGNAIVAEGSVAVGLKKDDSAAVHDGAMYAGTVLKETLAREGIAVAGRVRRALAYESAWGAEDRKAPLAIATTETLLVVHQSPPLSEIVAVINRNSQNFYAECLLKTLGRRVAGRGSFTAGAGVVRGWLGDRGLLRDGFAMVDGSGLSAENRVSARQLAGLARAMDRGGRAKVWRDSLPIGGERGSLKRRFQDTVESRALAPQIYGKTGLIGGVRSLAGMIVAPDGRTLYFAVLVNEFTKNEDTATACIDAVALALARGE